ncbi:MAG: hypothetical protein HZA15_16690 [Nitrospirae bacterium]|nr:hypothetical protein [Nitrospirota bacterium]
MTDIQSLKQIRGTLIFFLLSAVAFLSVASWFIAADQLQEQESAIRIILGSLVLLFMPGILWCEILGFRSDHVLETVALSFSLVLVIGILLLPLTLLLHATISFWSGCLLLICFTGLLLTALKTARKRELQFIPSLWRSFRTEAGLNYGTVCSMLVIGFMAYGTYRWGENIFDVDGEKLLHLTFIRYYFSMPLILKDLGIAQGSPPPNLIHLWEFLVAGWARVINIDPLFVFYRSRFLIPLAGLPGMFLLIKQIYTDRAKAEAIFGGVLLICLGWLILLSPSPLDWVKEDDLRGLMSFMSTAHHGDSAMEILIPLNAALVIMAFRNPAWRNLLLLGGGLSATFIWHTREFFQTALYMGVLGVVLLFMPSGRRRAEMIKWLKVSGVFVAVAAVFYLLMISLVTKEAHGYDEFMLKRIALDYALNSIADFRTLFHFPSDIRFTVALDKSQLLSFSQMQAALTKHWTVLFPMLLSALVLPFLAWRGDREDRFFAGYYAVLWFLLLNWGFSLFLSIVFTYSEILFTTPRMLYLFAYIVIAAGFYSFAGPVVQSGRVSAGRLSALAAGSLICGYAVRVWWDQGMPLLEYASLVLTILFVVSLVVMRRRPADVSAKRSPAGRGAVAVCCLGLFLVPALHTEYRETILKIAMRERAAPAWFGAENPFGMSQELVRFIQDLPSKQTFLVDPLGRSVISVYAPHYTVLPPVEAGKTLINELDAYAAAYQGRHVLFTMGDGTLQSAASSLPDPYALKAWLDQKKVHYILVEKKYYAQLLPFFQGLEQDYGIVFHNQGSGEFVVRYSGKNGQQG